MNVLCNSTDSINGTMFKKLWSLVLKLFLNARIHWAKIAVFVAYIYCVWPDRFASHYAYIRSDDMLGNLIESTTKNVSSMSTIDCDYSDIIEENRFMYYEPYISTLLDASGIKLGGEYTPECKPKIQHCHSGGLSSTGRAAECFPYLHSQFSATTTNPLSHIYHRAIRSETVQPSDAVQHWLGVCGKTWISVHDSARCRFDATESGKFICLFQTATAHVF